VAWQKVRIDIPPGFDAKTRLSIGRDIIEFIQTTAIEKNKGYNPATGDLKKFPKYTKKYADKKGTSVDNVDLVLSSEMFNAMDVLSTKPDSLLIGFENGTNENAKAEGNQLGSYGREPNPKKARPFLGIREIDLNRILKKYGESQSADNTNP